MEKNKNEILKMGALKMRVNFKMKQHGIYIEKTV